MALHPTFTVLHTDEHRRLCVPVKLSSELFTLAVSRVRSRGVVRIRRPIYREVTAVLCCSSVQSFALASFSTSFVLSHTRLGPCGRQTFDCLSVSLSLFLLSPSSSFPFQGRARSSDRGVPGGGRRTDAITPARVLLLGKSGVKF